MIPKPPNDQCKGKDEGKYNNPSELVGEKVGSFAQKLVFAIDVLRVHSCKRRVGLDSEESAHSDILESRGADVESIECRKKRIELLGKVEIDEHNQRKLLHILNRLEEEVFHSFHEN